MDLLLLWAGSADVPASIYNAVCLSPGAPPFFPAGWPAPVSTFSTPPLKDLHQFDMEWTTVHVLGLCSVADPDPHVFGPPGSGSIIVRGMDPDPTPDPSITKQK